MQNKSKFIEPKKGEVYGSLTLTGEWFFRPEKHGRRLRVFAQCKCGVIKDYEFKLLKGGNTKSCGCVRKEKFHEARITHNLSKHPLYGVYRDMLRRCYKTNCKAYKDYGGRGITVCDEWRNDIKAFFEWALSHGYEEWLQLDRQNNEGNYEPDNCRFVTKDVSNTNTRRNIIVMAFGQTKTLTDWSRDERCKVNFNTLLGRYRLGSDMEHAIITPAHADTKKIMREKQGKLIEAFGEKKSLIEWSEDGRCKIGYSGLKLRLSKGWSIEKAISDKPLRKIKK